MTEASTISTDMATISESVLTNDKFQMKVMMHLNVATEAHIWY